VIAGIREEGTEGYTIQIYSKVNRIHTFTGKDIDVPLHLLNKKIKVLGDTYNFGIYLPC